MATPAEIVAGTAVEIFLIAAAVGILYRIWGRIFAVPKRQVVPDFHRGIVTRGGKVEKQLDPGSYWIMPKRTLLLCDMRPRPFQVPSQELLTSDGMGVRMSLGGEHRIVDPAAYVTQSTDSFGAFYLELRHALLVAVGELNGDAVLSDRGLLLARVKELLVPKAAQLGIEIAQLDVWEAVPVGWLREV